MAETVNVPVFGPVGKGKLAGVLIGGTVVAGYLIYRKQKTAKKQAAAAATASAQAANAYGYGAQASYGYGGPYASGYYGYGASGGFNATGYYGYGTPYPAQPGAVAATTNAQWAQAAIAQLESEGYAPQAVSAALGAYERGQPVTPDQQTIVQSAIGIEGYPPDSGANGYPPSIQVSGTPGGGTGGGQGGGGGGGTDNAGAWTQALVGDPIAQAIATFQQNGIVINNVQGNGPTVKKVYYYPTGQAGDHFANSVTIVT